MSLTKPYRRFGLGSGEEGTMTRYIVALCLALLPAAASAQPVTYGTSAESVHTIQAFAFQADPPAAAQVNSALGAKYCNASCVFSAPLLLPAGAVVTRIELEGCDSSASGMISVLLDVHASPMQNALNVAGPSTGPPASTPGCGFFSVEPAAPSVPQIDNAFNAYDVQVLMSGGTVTTQFRAVRLFYRLQVSFAPGVATFGDVPFTHPFFQYIEALVASGITAGCGGGNYCPDAPLTRGQMAVFLSKALGLHFAP
jgi:hypothetical protein